MSSEEFAKGVMGMFASMLAEKMASIKSAEGKAVHDVERDAEQDVERDAERKERDARGRSEEAKKGLKDSSLAKEGSTELEKKEDLEAKVAPLEARDAANTLGGFDVRAIANLVKDAANMSASIDALLTRVVALEASVSELAALREVFFTGGAGKALANVDTGPQTFEELMEATAKYGRL